MRTDLLIVGAGLVGCVVAEALKKRMRVVVVDVAEAPGGLMADHASRETIIPRRGTWYLDVNAAGSVEYLRRHASFSVVRDGSGAIYPHGGWSPLCRNLLDGCEVILGAQPRCWLDLASDASKIVYTGRLDLLPWPMLSPTCRFHLGSVMLDQLRPGWLDWEGHEVIHVPMDDGPATEQLGDAMVRRHHQLVGGDSTIATVERPIPALLFPRSEPCPSAPAVTAASEAKAAQLRSMAASKYPNITLAGHLARYVRLDAAGAIAEGIETAKRIKES